MEALRELVDLVKALDANLTPQHNNDGFVVSYTMRTGYWHKIIALTRSAQMQAALHPEPEARQPEAARPPEPGEAPGISVCVACEGTGTITVREAGSHHAIGTATCPTCQGRGEAPRATTRHGEDSYDRLAEDYSRLHEENARLRARAPLVEAPTGSSGAPTGDESREEIDRLPGDLNAAGDLIWQAYAHVRVAALRAQPTRQGEVGPITSMGESAPGGVGRTGAVPEPPGEAPEGPVGVDDARLRAVAEQLAWMVAQEHLTFAECSVAEEWVGRAQAALTLVAALRRATPEAAPPPGPATP